MISTFLAGYFCLLPSTTLQKVNTQKKTDAAIVFNASKESVFKIKTNKATGTGFLFKNSNTVATCYHVIEGATSITVEGSNDAKWDVVSIQYNEKADVAVLTIDRPSSRKPLQPIKSLPQIGEKAFVIGNPLGFLTNSLTEGIVSAIRRDSESDATVIQVSAAISPGSSGSPILNAAGQVMGFASFSFAKGQSLNMGISHEELQKVLLREDIPAGLFYTNIRKNELEDDGAQISPLLPSKLSEKQKKDLVRLLEKITLTYIDVCDRDEFLVGQKDSAVSAFSKFWVNSNSSYSELANLPDLVRLVDSFESALTRYTRADSDFQKFIDLSRLSIIDDFVKKIKQFDWAKEEARHKVFEAYNSSALLICSQPDLSLQNFPGWLKFYYSSKYLRFSEDGIVSKVIPEPYSQACELADSCLGPGGWPILSSNRDRDKTYEEAISELAVVRRGDKITEICDLNNDWHQVDDWDQLCDLLEKIQKQNVAMKTFKLKARVKTQKGSTIYYVWMGEVDRLIK